MTWTAEQIREWFEARPRFEYEPGLFSGAPRRSVIDAHKPTPKGLWLTETRQFTPEELDELLKRHSDV